MPIVNVTIHSEISEFPTEKRYDSEIQISELKKKLELITGANHKTMKISLSVGDKKADIDDDNQTLAHFIGQEVTDGMNIVFEVKDDQMKELLSGDVPKYTISDDKYKERPDNVRDFIKQTREKQKAASPQS